MSQVESQGKVEIGKLRDQLDGNDPLTRKSAAKKVVALMRAGENVQSLFASMQRCVQTRDMELKKLVYLYLVNYSSQEPEQAIMTVGTFIKDSEDNNPLIRALAVRTMCRVKLESVAENMVIPLKRCLSDPDPYVRKTAAFGVSKLYDVIPEVVENAHLFKDLLNLLNDENPMVVSNTTAAIFEINERRTQSIFHLDSNTITPLLSTLSSSSEWCQINILDALSHYIPESPEDASFLIERLVPFLKHNNPGVVIGSFKCIFLYLDYDPSKKENPGQIFSQIIPPFITLVTSAESEVQYVVLRTLSLFVHKYPRALQKEIRVFFSKYNDPNYVKMEKLDILVTICSATTAQLILDELQEYCNSVDVAFVKKSVRAVGQIAIKIEPSARRCVDILVGLISLNKADYAIEEAVIVMCDILRKFPGTFESTITAICTALASETIKEPKAKASAIWILGEYCSLIENADELLDPFLDSFRFEATIVQRHILTSLVKIFLEKPDSTRDQLQFVLTEATKDGISPDVKNRAMIYWRLLSSAPNDAKNIIFFSKQTIIHSGLQFSDSVLAELIRNMGMVSGILHIVPSDFVKRVKFVPEEDENYDQYNDNPYYPRLIPANLNDNSIVSIMFAFQLENSEDSQNPPPVVQEDDLLGGLLGPSIHSNIINNNNNITSNGQNEMKLLIKIMAETDIRDLALAINKNALGLTLNEVPVLPVSMELGDVYETSIKIVFNPANILKDKKELQFAMRTSKGTIYGTFRLPVELATMKEGEMTQDEWKNAFASMQSVDQCILEDVEKADIETLRKRNIFTVGVNGNKSYIAFMIQNQKFVAELNQDGRRLLIGMKSTSPDMFPVIKASANELFTQKL